MRMYDIPRRVDTQRYSPAEKAISDAMTAVEKLPADIRLTDAVILLGAAKARVADYVDGVDGVRIIPQQFGD